MLGALALVPYTLRLVKASKKPIKASATTVAVAGFVQNAIFFALVTAGGLFVARAAGLKATPVIDAILAGRSPARALQALEWAAGLGAAAGVFLLVADLVFLPRMPALLALSRKASLWENFAASLYGGINEELLMRLLGVSGLAWLLAHFVWNTQPGHPPDAAFWWSIAAMSVLFGLGHLPATASITKLTPLILIRALLLNGVVGVLCGYLFWRYGLEAAIAAHYVTDIVYHVFGTALLKLNVLPGLAPTREEA